MKGRFLPLFGSVRLRLTVFNVAVLAMILIVLGTAFRYRLHADNLAAIDRQLADKADSVQRHLPPDGPLFLRRPPPPPPDDGPGPPPPNNNPPPEDNPPPDDNPPPANNPPADDGPPPPDEADNGSPFNLRPRAFDRQGQSLFPTPTDRPWDTHTGWARALQGQASYTQVTQNGIPLRVFSLPLRRNGLVVGVAQAAISIAPLEDADRQMRRTLLTFIPLALAIAGIGGAFLTDRALRPVRQMTQSASRIEAASLSGRLPVIGRDEFALLAATFNALLGRLEEAFARLEKAFQQQQRFTADASHELRTPLTIIKANTSLALSGERTSDQYRGALTAADKAADRMNRIVQDLLLLARADAAQWQPHLVPTPLADVLEQAAQPLRLPANPTITIALPAETLEVMGDAHSLLRVFANLLENAVRHTPTGGQISVVATEGAQFVNITVADNGEGIGPEHITHLTERFYRVDDARARERGGTGLGLAICLSIVQAHGGTLTLDSVPGQGTTVTVTLPRAC